MREFALCAASLLLCSSLRAQQAFEPIQPGGLAFSGSVRDLVENRERLAPAGNAVIQAVYPKGKDGHLAFLEANYRF